MKVTNKFNLPKPLVDACSQEYTYRPKRYSVTTILNEPKKVLLTRRHNDEIEQDASDMIWLIFGTAVHNLLENAQEGSTELKEASIEYLTKNGYTMSGRFDLYDMESGLVTDYKTGSVNKVLFNNVDDYIKQGKYYCIALRQMGFKASSFEIVMILKDWVQSKAKFDADYPQHPINVWHFDFTEIELDEAELEVNKYFEELERLELLEDDEIPACSKEYRTFGRKDQYAVRKFNRKTALRVLDSMEEAQDYLNNVGGDFIEIRVADDMMCKDYCNCKQYCSHWKQIMKEIKEGENNE